MDDVAQMNGGVAAAAIHHHTNHASTKTLTNHNNNHHHQQHLTHQQQQPFLCSGCSRPIVDQYLLKALDLFWHEDCLKCGCCDCRLGEVGSTLYTKANLILCKRDYLRMFGTSGSCAACCKPIPAFEMVMRAKNNVYHLDCFACQQCHQRFCVGDRFYLNDNKILCEYDYEEQVTLSNPQQHVQRRVSDQSENDALNYALRPHDTYSSEPRDAATYRHSFVAQHRQLHHHQHHNQQHKHGSSPSDGSSSGYGSPDSVLLEER